MGSTKLPFSKSPHTIVLPGQRGVVEKSKHGKDINSFASPETIEEITNSKVPVHDDHVQQQLVGANDRAGVVGVQSLHRLIYEL